MRAYDIALILAAAFALATFGARLEPTLLPGADAAPLRTAMTLEGPR